MALLIAAYSAWKTNKFNERQKTLIEVQELLNKRLLEKEQADTIQKNKTGLGVNFIKLGSDSYRLKVWNKGPAPARNVRISFPEGNDIIVDSELTEKFPLESLEVYQSVELIATACMQSKRKHVIKLDWSDDFSEDNEKLLYPTL